MVGFTVKSLSIVLWLLQQIPACLSTWMTKEAAAWAVKEFEEKEVERSTLSWRGTDRRPAFPFISGDGFRSICNHICEDANRCRMDPLAVKDGECVFVKTDFFPFFIRDVVTRIPGRYIIVSHNGDLSAPDGQNDARKIGMPGYVVTDLMHQEYAKGRLIAHHGQNLWWINNTFTPRPVFSHCLPIGFENRQYKIGMNVKVYAEYMRRYIINKPIETVEQKSKRPLLLIAFYPKSRVPDRTKVLNILGVYKKNKPEAPFYNYTDLSHSEWLVAITEHKFVLAPFGHGLDTHRVSEILLMGGIPVMRRSTISSCYDDSDNTFGNITKNPNIKSRGSLPVVIVDKWEDLTKELLDKEWDRISKIPNEHWDYKRVFADHWIDRIKSS